MHLTRFWSGTCHRGFKNISVPKTNFWRTYIRPFTNFSYKVYQKLKSYTRILKVPCRSLNQYCENRYPSQWHVPVLKKLPWVPEPRKCENENKIKIKIFLFPSPSPSSLPFHSCEALAPRVQNSPWAFSTLALVSINSNARKNFVRVLA